MKVYRTEDIRNVVVIGHGSVGKTMITEAALYLSGATTRMGTIADQNTVSDFDEDEHARKFSLNLAVVPVEWDGHKINFIDTPGYADFVSEVTCGARAADLALVVIDGVAGPEVGTDRAWAIADQMDLPRMVVVNKLDRENANYQEVVAALRARWGHKIAPLQLPIGTEHDFRGVVNLLHMRAYVGPNGDEIDVPAELVDEARELRGTLIESIAENDEHLMEQFFADEELDEDELEAVLKRELLAQEIIPVLATAAPSEIGMRRLLDAVVRSGPSPVDRGLADADGSTIHPDPQGPPAALVFKTSADPYVGKLSYLRVVRGEVTPDVHLWNVKRDADERLHTLFTQRGKEQSQVERLPAGDIGVVTKLSHAETGDTLAAKDHPIALPPIVFPPSVYSMAVIPKDKSSVDKLGPSLHRLIEEDPALQLSRDNATGQTVLSGLGDAHLEVATGRLSRKFNVEVDLALPRVPYRETVSTPASADYTHKKQTGGHGQYARVALEIAPAERGSGLVFESKVVGGAVPREFIPAVEKGIHETAAEGVFAGYDLTDCRVTLVDGKHHPVDSSEMAFKLAAAQALREAVHEAGASLLEPVMTIRVRAPEASAGDVVGDLNTKRARIHGIMPDGDMSTIEAEVPLAEVQRYASDLRSLTQGRGSFEISFDHYGEVPANVAQRVAEGFKSAAESAAH